MAGDGITIICQIRIHFWANVSQLDAWERFIIFQRAKLDDEWMDVHWNQRSASTNFHHTRNFSTETETQPSDELSQLHFFFFFPLKLIIHFPLHFSSNPQRYPKNPPLDLDLRLLGADERITVG